MEILIKYESSSNVSLDLVQNILRKHHQQGGVRMTSQDFKSLKSLNPTGSTLRRVSAPHRDAGNLTLS